MRWLRWRRPKPVDSKRVRDPAECDHPNAKLYTGSPYSEDMIVCPDCITLLAKVLPREPWLY
ncbi:hypothetical protein [Saccharopolyspora spinosa]|nr:hypothetical protein [Saccharopolyspora spinosa]